MSEKASKSKKATKPKTTTSKSKKKTETKAKTTSKTKAKPKTAAKPKVKPKTAKKTKKKRKAKIPVKEKPKKSRPRRLPLETPVKGVLMNFQRGTVRQQNQYGLIQLQGVSSISTAATYIGRSVILHFNERTKNYGRVVSVHGRKGVLRVRFRQKLAPEALAKEVIVL